MFGCKNSIVKKVEVNESCFFIPNLITPNNDGDNDNFEVKGIGKEYTLEVYNRWNQLIYRKENYNNTFSGNDCRDGVYYFILTNEKNGKEYKGWLQIIR